MTSYETVIGLEVHAQVLTESKMFCGCSAQYASGTPNTHVCPVCMALPGSLPVINSAAVEKTIIAGLALNCRISEHAVFARKNYHCADLPKGYQISQYELPFCRDGWLEIGSATGKKRIGITRAHLEEDTGKLVHAALGGRLAEGGRLMVGGEIQTLVDLNRAGTPLLEIVTEPDIRSAEEAHAYLIELQRILRYLGVSSADMEKGAMRCEANVSVRPAGQERFGTKVEVKNLNSFRSVRLALEYEVRRQIDALERGEKVVQVTMGWDEEAGRTVLQRSKESSDDYRYFPEPDLPPVEVSGEWVEALRKRVPELPAAKAARFAAELGLEEKEAALLADYRAVSEYFEATTQALQKAAPALDAPAAAKVAFNWITGELFRLVKASGAEIDAVKVTPGSLAALLGMVQSGQLNQNGAKRALAAMVESGREAARVAQELGLTQVSDTDALASIVAKVIEDNEDQVLKYRSGKESVFNWLLGQIMRETRGRGNPALVRELLEAALRE